MDSITAFLVSLVTLIAFSAFVGCAVWLLILFLDWIT